MPRHYDPSVKGIRLIDLSGAVICEYTGPDWQNEFEVAFLKYFSKIKKGEYTIQTYQVSKTIYVSGTQMQCIWLPPFQSATTF